MTRNARVYFQNAVYHVTTKGNNRQNVLKGSRDKETFLNCLGKFKARFGFKLYALVLMDNHLHLLIQADSKINISKIMHAISLSYSVKFRKKYGYSGYVWQGRFKSNVIDDDMYILRCIEYIHNNPVRAGLVSKAEDYPWSSYHIYNGSQEKMNRQIQLLIDRFTG
jgi:REP element-mobilizing transposase RayT